MKGQTSSKLIIFVVVALVVGILLGYGVGIATVPATTVTVTTTYTATVTGTPSTSPTTPPPTRVTLTVLGPWAGAEAEYFNEVLNAFMQKYPHIEIKYVVMRAEDVAKVAPLHFEAGTTPADVIITPWAWWIVEMAKRGYVVDITDLINPDEYVSGIVDKVTYNGRIYGAPFTMWLKPGFWYRKSFFQTHGLQEPKTWDEFLQLVDSIKGIPGIEAPIATGDGVGWPISDVAEHFIIAFGGPELQLKLINCEVKFNDPSVKDIFNKLASLIKNGYFSEPIEWTTAKDLWWEGKYGIYFMGTWITGMVDDPNDLDFFPLPGTRGVVGGADYAFIPKFTERLEEAKLFIEFFATEGQRYHVSVPSGKIPTWKKVSAEDLWAPMRSVYQKIVGADMEILPDLDDTVGGDWQTLFWDQLKLLWAQPDMVSQILDTLTQNHPACKA